MILPQWLAHTKRIRESSATNGIEQRALFFSLIDFFVAADVYL